MGQAARLRLCGDSVQPQHHPRILFARPQVNLPLAPTPSLQALASPLCGLGLMVLAPGWFRRHRSQGGEPALEAWSHTAGTGAVVKATPAIPLL